MGGEKIRKMYSDATNLKNTIMKGKNIDILLYLAKYNPEVSKKDITDKMGKKSLSGLKELESFNLVREDNENLTLTSEGLFQVEGLITLTC